MKFNLIAGISLTITLALFNEGTKAQNGKYTLDVKTNATDSKLFIFQKSGTIIKLDSLVSADGIFHKEGEVNTPYKVRLFLVPKSQSSNETSFKKGFPIYLEPGNITITSDGQTLDNCVLSGTPSNDDLYAYNKMRKPFISRMNPVSYTHLTLPTKA